MAELTEYRDLLTGKNSGKALRYRSVTHCKRLATRPYIVDRYHYQYIEEWIQEDGSSKFFIVDRQWNETSINAKLMRGDDEVLCVRPYNSLEEAQESWEKLGDD